MIGIIMKMFFHDREKIQPALGITYKSYSYMTALTYIKGNDQHKKKCPVTEQQLVRISFKYLKLYLILTSTKHTNNIHTSLPIHL